MRAFFLVLASAAAIACGGDDAGSAGTGPDDSTMDGGGLPTAGSAGPPVAGSSGAGTGGGSGGAGAAGHLIDAGVIMGRDAGDALTDAFFDPERIVEVEIELSAADWELMRHEGHALTEVFSGCAGDYEYTTVVGSVTIDGDAYDDVEIRKKGYLGSLSVKRPSIKLDLGELVEGRTHSGMRRMTLNNDRQDPSHTHQCMAYDLFRAAGAIASRCNFAHVTVNGEDLGVYTNVEGIKKPMLRRYFSDDSGNLYEGQRADFVAAHRDDIELKTNEMENDRSDFDRLAAALQTSDDELLPALSEVLDIDAFLTFWAMEVITGHWDSYSGGPNNYLAYDNPENGLFYFIPWGTDGAWTAARPFHPQNTAATVQAEGFIASRLYNHPEGRGMYFERVRALLDEVWDETALQAEADRIGALISAPADSISKQKAFIRSHGNKMRTELAAEPVEWIGGGEPTPLACRADTVSEVSGSFATTWGSTGMAVAGGQMLDIQIDGRPFVPTLLLGAADTDDNDPNMASLRILSPLSSGEYLVVVLLVPKADLAAGVIPMHGLETSGRVARVDPQSPSSAVLIGFIGDGTITLDAAGMSQGDPIEGSFEGMFVQTQLGGL